MEILARTIRPKKGGWGRREVRNKNLKRKELQMILSEENSQTNYSESSTGNRLQGQHIY